MNKFFILTLLILVPIISATYSGDSETITLPEQFDYYSIVGNSTPIDLTVINLTEDWLIINMTINKYQQTDNFTIIFFNKEKEVITQTIYSGGGGGGGSTKYIDRNVTVLEPRFYDRNNTKIVEKEITNEKTIYEEPNPIWFYVSIFVIVLCIIFAILYLRSDSREEIISDKREVNEYE